MCLLQNARSVLAAKKHLSRLKKAEQVANIHVQTTGIRGNFKMAYAGEIANFPVEVFHWSSIADQNKVCAATTCCSGESSG